MKTALFFIASTLLVSCHVALHRANCARTNALWIALFVLGTAAAAGTLWLDAGD